MAAKKAELDAKAKKKVAIDLLLLEARRREFEGKLGSQAATHLSPLPCNNKRSQQNLNFKSEQPPKILINCPNWVL